MSISLYSHQKKAVDKLGSGSILCGGVGSGKSRTAIAYYFSRECGGTYDAEGNVDKMKHPKDLYIITTARKRDTCDWEKELSPFLLSTDKNPFGVRIFIDSWNNIKKYVDAKDAFFIFDEQRVVGNGTWVKSFLKITKKNRWILLSATPGDTWSDYIPVFLANGFYRNRTEFSRKHIVYSRFSRYPKIERYVGTKRLERLRDKITVTMPMKRHTTRHFKDIFVSFDEGKYNQISKSRWNIFENQPIKDASEVCYTMRRLVNSDRNRIEAVRKLIKDNPKVIIFYNFDYELLALRDLLYQECVVYGEWNGHKHLPIPDSDRWVYLVQYTAGAEGWNCIETNVIIFYSLNYSYKIMEQAAGRIDRMNTPFKDLYYYRIRSRSSIDNAIFSCLGKKQRFNEKVFAGKQGFAV